MMVNLMGETAFFLLITFSQAQSETDAVATPGPEDEISKLQERGLAVLEIRILTANLPDDLLVTLY